MDIISVSQALENLRDAREMLEASVEAHFPPGTPVFWQKQGSPQNGHVVRPVGDRVLVRNDISGCKYFVHAYVLTPKFKGGRKCMERRER